MLRQSIKWCFLCLVAVTLLLVPGVYGIPGGGDRAYASSTVPALTVTEILANSNGDSSSITDSYEYVELKNNTGSSIDLAGYKFIFWYTPTASVTWDLTASQTLAAGAVRVVWIKNTYAQGKTLANFNSHYGTSFTSSTLYTLDLGANGGLGNTGFKKLIVATDAGDEVCTALYNDRIATSTTLDEDAVTENGSIVYQFPDYLVDGNKKMRKVAANQKPTPGTVPSPPNIWITELMVNSSSPVDDLEAFEFIELYNNTGSAIDLAGYTIRYYWDYANPANYYDYNLTASKSIPAYGYMVVWTRGTQSSGYTLAQFADHYNLASTYLTSAKVYEQTVTQTQGMGNGGQKKIELRTDGGTVIVDATYNDGTASPGSTTIDTAADTSVTYGFPVDGTKSMRKQQYPTPGSPYNFYNGQLHNHTGHSHEGSTAPTNTPANAYLAAKAEDGDFYGLSDHSERMDGGDPNVANGEWADNKYQADFATEPHQFSAFAGFEMTYNTASGIWGHSNVFNVPWIVDRHDTIGGVQYNMHHLWDDLAENPEAVLQFNHPSGYWGDFEDFAYYNEAADDQSALYEFQAGTLMLEHFDKYFRALDRGWHVSPSLNSDIHNETWMQNDDRTIVLAEANTREAIMDAIRARRTYATFGDRDFKLTFEINGKPMGSRLTNPGSTLNVSVLAANPTNDAISKITLYGPGGQGIGSQTYSSRMAHYTASIPPRYAYYFAKVEQTDGDWAVSAPIWIADAPPMELEMSTQSTAVAGVPVQINAGVTNTTGGTLSNVLVEFYKDDFTTSTDNYTAANKLGDVTLASIASGATATASSTWAPAGGAGTYTVLARVTATVGGVSKSVTGGIHLPELYITEIVANSPGNTGVDDGNGVGDYVDEDYDFIEVYNNSKNMVNLKDYKLKDTYETPVDITTDFYVPAKTAKVIWFKKTGSTKTLAQFNAAYGTSLTSSDVLELYQTSVARADNPLRYSGMARIELVRDSDGVSILQARYNNGTNTREVHGPAGTHGTDPSVDGRALKFKYPVDGSYYLQEMSGGNTPTPGTVTSDQIAP
ncbi:lamin tail domain-containing protein [Paenibacillus sp. HJGM_3]|uniref:lamin tail domain-containing protein n=1 Tax=Paenibacillus sp. HJGM_3 TaxID=3379816 RepID=UPI00385F2F5E